MIRSGLLPYLWMLLGALAFAGMAVLTAELKEELAWQWIAVARSGLAMVFAAALVLGAGVRFVLLRPRTLWMRSLAGSVSLLCGFFAMTHYHVAVVLTLTNMYPLWVAVLSWPLLGVVPKRDTWLAAGIGVIGVAILGFSAPPATISPAPQAAADVPVASAAPVSLTTADAGSALAARRLAPWAIAASLVAAFTSAVALIGLHRLRELDARSVVVHFSGVSLALCLVAAGALPHNPPVTSWSPVVGLMLLGVGVCATIGQLFLTKAFAAGEPTKVSVVGLSQTGFAMLLDGLVHPRYYSPGTLAGMGLILAPTAWVLLRGRAAGSAEQNGTAVAATDAPHSPQARN